MNHPNINGAINKHEGLEIWKISHYILCVLFINAFTIKVPVKYMCICVFTWQNSDTWLWTL